jgi:hypothetical protein
VVGDSSRRARHHRRGHERPGIWYHRGELISTRCKL